MRYLLTVVLFLIHIISFSQGVVTKKYTIENGLMANDVRALCVDSKGILWIGSRSGLTQKIQGVVRPNEDAARYRYTNITDVVEDDYQGIWVGSYGQGILYRGKDEVRIISTQQGLVSNRIRRIFAHEEYVYVATSDGVSIISMKDYSIVNPTFRVSDNNPFEVSDFFVYEGGVYVSTINDGIYKVVEDKLVLVEKVGKVFAAIQVDGLVFYGCEEGLIVKNMSTNTIVKKYDIPPVKDIKRANNQLYIVSGGTDDNNSHIYRWDGVSLENITEYLGVLATDFYSIGYDEKNDFLYLGTKSQGVFQVDLFSALSFDSSIGGVSVIKELKDRIFLFSTKGMFVQNKNGKIFELALSRFKEYQEQHYKKYVNLTTKGNHFYEIDYATLAERIVFYSAVVHGDSIWVSSNIGVFQVGYNGYILSYHSIHTYQFGFYQNQFIETNPFGGVRIYEDLFNMKYKYFFRMDSKNIPRDIVDITYVDDKMYFAGALDGLYVLDKDGFLSIVDTNYFMENRLKKIAKGPNNTLYVATDFNDVYLLETKSGKYQVKDFISNKEIVGSNISLLKYYKDKIFIGTSKGLSVLGKDSRFYFNKEQGLGNAEILSYALKDNLLYIGTTEGLYVLDIDYFNRREVEYNVNISQIEINGKELNKKGVVYYDIRELYLKSKENNIHLSFEILGTKFPNKLSFQYRLKLGETWMSVKDNKLDLHYLEPGVYPIDIKIQDFDSGNELIYPLLYLEIEKPFYAKTWFVILSVSILLGLSFLFYRVRLMRLRRVQITEKKKLEYEKRLAEVKFQVVRSQMNSHFIFNVLSSIQYYIIKEKVDDALFYLERFAKLIRTTLDMSSKEIITLKEECEYLRTYVDIENMRLDGRVDFKVDRGAVDIGTVSVPPLLLQPFIENSLVHAFPISVEKPTLTISMYKENDSDLRIEIRDNGIGSASIKEKHHESKGLSIVKERMSLKQHFSEEDLVIVHDSKGTTVKIILKNVLK
ncbi:histidine kinase [Myroides sp. M-43]|uniref:sensor histidine kinase n=1 Tax=Myroides oncorhynchi TaxID=2893756 RepID=UPI001E647586|nr:histidine kinase [Myroides oncorhynchi]MCC9041327.1 histidine kinase [Myroides oncorhynchi]